MRVGVPVAAPFTLYSRSWCHLCDDLLAALRALETLEQPFDITVLDVDADPALEARFNELVPVLYAGSAQQNPSGEELCHYFLDEAAVRRHLAAVRRSPA